MGNSAGIAQDLECEAEDRAITLGAQFGMYYDARPARDRIDLLLTIPVAERERSHYEAMRARLYGA